MPAQRSPAAPSLQLPAVDEATAPFSALFDNKHGFDLKTVEETAQLADRSIFVASNGRRFLVESIPDDRASDGNTYPGAGGGQSPAHSPPAPSSPASPQAANSRPSAAQAFGALLRNSLRRRPASTSTSSSRPPSYHRSTGRSPYSPTTAPSPVSPTAPAAELGVSGMASDVNSNRFSATPLYWQSDGGVQAAEALTDPYAGPRPPASPASASTSPVSPSPQLTPHAHTTIYGLQPSPDPHTIPPHVAGLSGHIVNFDYVHYTEQANYQVQQSRQVSPPTGLPSLLEFSSPMPTPSARRPSDLYSPVEPPVCDPEKEFLGPHARADYPPPPRSSASATGGLRVPEQVGPQANYVNIGQSYSSGNGGYDLLTPVVVHPPITHTPSYSSDGASTTRDNVLPGEVILYDGPVRSAHTLNAPVFQDGQLKVFRNTLSNDLRFHCKVGHESETYWSMPPYSSIPDKCRADLA